MSALRLPIRPVAFAVILLALAAVFFPPAPVHGQTYSPIATLADGVINNGDCNLREAALAATTNAVVDLCPAGSENGGDVINLQKGSIYTLQRSGVPGAGHLSLGNTNNVGTLAVQCVPGCTSSPGLANHTAITMGGGQSDIIRIEDNSRVDMELIEVYGNGPGINIRPGATSNLESMFIHDNPNGSGVSAGDDSTVNITDSVIKTNSTGVVNQGTMTITGTDISENTDTGIVNSGSDFFGYVGDLTVDDSTINDNGATGIWQTGDLVITDSTIDGNHGYGDNGGGIYYPSNPDVSLTIENTTITNNEAIEFGGGIYSENRLTITDSTVSNNTAGDDGGGIYSDFHLEMTNTHVDGNTSGSVGGGLWLGHDQKLITGGSINNNTSMFAGGGIYVPQDNFQSEVILEDVTMSGNGSGQGGAGIYTYGPLTVRNSRILNNTAATNCGGGIYSVNAVDIYRTLIQGNEADDNAIIGGGGGICSAASLVNLVESLVRTNTPGGVYGKNAYTGVFHSTISENSGGVAGLYTTGETDIVDSTISKNTLGTSAGGFYTTADAILKNNTFKSNTGSTGTVPDNIGIGGGTTTVLNTIIDGDAGALNCGATKPVSNGHNLENENDCALTGTADLVNTDPKLDILFAWQPSTPSLQLTHKLKPGSPAVDAADNSVCTSNPLNRDERGQTRPKDGNQDGVAICDIGAFEAAPGTNPSPTPTPVGQTPTPSPSKTPTPTPKPTATRTPSPTPAPTPVGQTPSPIPSLTPTLEPTPIGQTPSPTSSPSPTPEPTPVGQTPSPTPSGLTPTPTNVPTVTPTASPSPTPFSTLIRGDVRCNGLVDFDDIIALLEYLAGLIDSLVSSCQYPAGEEIYVGIVWDDTDCDLDVDLIDVLNLLLYRAGLAPLIQGCSEIGEPLPVP